MGREGLGRDDDDGRAETPIATLDATSMGSILP
jgi:hypothetical protein